MAVDIVDLLIQIREINESLFLQADAHLSRHATLPSHQDCSSFVPPIAFDVPSWERVSSILVDHGAPIPIAKELAMIHTERASELADKYSTIYQTTCTELAQIWRPSSLKSTRHLYQRIMHLTETFSHTVATWEEELIRTVQLRFSKKETSFPHYGGAAECKGRFNKSCVVKLEAYFERNRFPSYADRSFLAKESGMSIRQVNVWFQNRRARIRKSDKGACVTHHALANRNRNTTRSSVSRKGMKKSGISHTTSSGMLANGRVSHKITMEEASFKLPSVAARPKCHPFERKPPAYAFPTIYPPSLDRDPFPCCLGDFTFPKPEWPRRPNTVHANHMESSEIDILISRFAEMYIQGDSPVGTPRSVLPHGCLSAADMRVRVYSAPLPACVPSADSAYLTEDAKPGYPLDYLRRRARHTDFSMTRETTTKTAEFAQYWLTGVLPHTDGGPFSPVCRQSANRFSEESSDSHSFCSVGMHEGSPSIDSVPPLCTSSNSPSSPSSSASSPSSTVHCLPDSPAKGSGLENLTLSLNRDSGFPFSLDHLNSYFCSFDPTIPDMIV